MRFVLLILIAVTPLISKAEFLLAGPNYTNVEFDYFEPGSYDPITDSSALDEKLPSCGASMRESLRSSINSAAVTSTLRLIKAADPNISFIISYQPSYEDENRYELVLSGTRYFFESGFRSTVMAQETEVHCPLIEPLGLNILLRSYLNQALDIGRILRTINDSTSTPERNCEE